MSTFVYPVTTQFEFGFVSNQATMSAGNDDTEISDNEDYCECKEEDSHECGERYTCPICKREEKFSGDDVNMYLESTR